MNYNNLLKGYKINRVISSNEFVEYIKQSQLGNLEAREVVINNNIRLVASRVFKKFQTTSYEKNELLSVGLIGLMKAVDTFKIDKGYKFSTYAAKCIDNEILSYLRKDKKHLKIDSLDRIAIKNQDGDETTIEELIKDDNDFTTIFFEKEELLEIRKQIEKLDYNDKEIIKLYFGFYNKRYTQEEIANILNMKQSNLSKKIKRIILKLKQNILDDDLIENKIYAK